MPRGRKRRVGTKNPNEEKHDEEGKVVYVDKQQQEDERAAVAQEGNNLEDGNRGEGKPQDVAAVSGKRDQQNVEVDKRDEDNAAELEEPKNGRRRPKRGRISKREQEPEYFPDQRNLWDQLDSVYQYNWNFSNLEDALDDGGELHGQRVYLFGSTEPQMVPFKEQQKIICIPVVVAVVSPFPPSDKIGINSVQRETEEIIPMKQMKMDWMPYIPLDIRERQVERLKSEIFILRCTQRKSALKHLKVERVKKFEYCLPYFYHPFKEDELEQSTVVQILYPIDPKPVFCEFDWEFDEVEEFTDKLIEAEELSADQKDEFTNFVKEKVREAKKANREAREARKKTLAEMSHETKAAYEKIRFYKFYPVTTPDSPDVSSVKAPFINRYYGKAHKVL